MTNIDGRSFSRKATLDSTDNYGKSTFAKYIARNYSEINFEGFKPVLDNMNKIIEEYKGI